jgi:aerobic carbon-monoxide dehydrogenase large subunit
MTKFGSSQAVRRVEDARFITGAGRYTDDITLPGQAYGVMLRSPHAHARIGGIGLDAARQADGVLAVYTFADLKADGIGDLPCMIPLKSRDGGFRADPPRPALANGAVRHVGDPVAFVVAETTYAARAAAELIEVDYEILDAVADMPAAAAPGAPLIWPQAPGNRCFDWETGQKDKTDKLFAQAAHVTRLEVVNNRVVVATIEPRGALAAYDRAAGKFTLYTGTQSSFLIKGALAGNVFKLPPEKFRVVTPDVGGAFGMKFFVYPEPVMCLYAARKLGRPVKWTSERGEAFLSDTQGRDNLSTGELALDGKGNFLALRVHTRANLGAYLSTFAPMIPTSAGTKVLTSIYRFQAMYARVEGMFTNTVPVDAYRGAGRPEANYLMERLIDKAAMELGIDRAELRRRNFIPPEAMPWTSAAGQIYDSGEFAALLETALKESDWTGFAPRRAAALAQGRRRGIGLACYLEATAGPVNERAEIRFAKDDVVEVLVGTQSSGQGHETAYSQLVNERLGVPLERIRVLQGDSDLIPTGGGTGGARSLYAEGVAIVNTADKVIENGKAAAGHLLEAAAADIEFAAGQFRIAGTDRRIGILELAKRVREASAAPGAPGAPGANGMLDAVAQNSPDPSTYPNGCHVAEVEIDTETGAVAVVRYTVVDDMGRVLNPMIVTGQIQGGVAQGIGQALFEHTAYGADGQLLAGSFMDYCLPHADQLPGIDVILRGVPCKTNALGVKGAGEAGAVGAAPAIVSALLDALKDLGVERIDMPVTSEKIWRLLRGAQRT